MVYSVYIWACYNDADDDTSTCYYTGYTNDIERREGEHARYVEEHIIRHYTGRFDGGELIWHEEVSTKEEALELEQYIKHLSPKAKEAYMEEHGVIVAKGEFVGDEDDEDSW
jgi:predicted GIY-YIG superfamily endonuclease